jgi:hypothetical protein
MNADIFIIVDETKRRSAGSERDSSKENPMQKLRKITLSFEFSSKLAYFQRITTRRENPYFIKLYSILGRPTFGQIIQFMTYNN